MTGRSSATYCLCKDGVGDQMLQKTLDYACGAGADCQAQGSCDFSGAATVSATPPPNIASTCSFPSSSTGTHHRHTTPTGTTSGSTTTGTIPGTTPTTEFGGAGTTLGPTTGINDPGNAVGLITYNN
ncbi:Chaperone DnaJ-domain superfamily protein [Hibiscus syriacus]|uniref:Chaperone DnaJ-domain superfamily protein n=1 Tax=Hibiscus syriacus TaxID=106335 RepID=A0A6A3D0R3_HIBSY|nr:Chaperone DnaJ-domain superfamily protein [Hibiscus syriacus]